MGVYVLVTKSSDGVVLLVGKKVVESVAVGVVHKWKDGILGVQLTEACLYRI